VRDTPETFSPRTVGVWQTAFLGDAVLTLPLLANLKAAWPAARLHFFVRRGAGALFAAQPELASVREVDKRGELKSLAASLTYGRKLAREGFDLWVSAHTSLRSALVARAAAAPRRVGYDAPLWNRLAYTDVVPRRFAELAEIERLHQLLLPLGVPVSTDWPGLALVPAAAARAEELLSGLPRPVLGLHPGSVWPTKRWPAAHFARVADLALAEGTSVVLFAGPGEEATAAEVRAACSGAGSARFLDLSGRLTLPELAAAIARLDCYLTNDSGPMHIAWALKVPVVAMFGPTVKAHGFFPRGATTRVLELDLSCRPCGLHGGRACRLGHHRCLQGLEPDAAYAVVGSLLGSRRAGSLVRIRQEAQQGIDSFGSLEAAQVGLARGKRGQARERPVDRPADPVGQGQLAAQGVHVQMRLAHALGVQGLEIRAGQERGEALGPHQVAQQGLEVRGKRPGQVARIGVAQEAESEGEGGGEVRLVGQAPDEGGEEGRLFGIEGQAAVA